MTAHYCYCGQASEHSCAYRAQLGTTQKMYDACRDELARLREDNERMKRNHNDIVAPMVHDLKAELARLREALTVFAEALDYACDEDAEMCWKAARNALKETQEAKT